MWPFKKKAAGFRVNTTDPSMPTIMPDTRASKRKLRRSARSRKRNTRVIHRDEPPRPPNYYSDL